MFVPFLNTSADSTLSDISKVSKFNKNVVNIEKSAVEEELRNDPEMMEETNATLSIMTARMIEFDEVQECGTSESVSDIYPAQFVRYGACCESMGK